MVEHYGFHPDVNNTVLLTQGVDGIGNKVHDYLEHLSTIGQDTGRPFLNMSFQLNVGRQ